MRVGLSYSRSSIELYNAQDGSQSAHHLLRPAEKSSATAFLFVVVTWAIVYTYQLYWTATGPFFSILDFILQSVELWFIVISLSAQAIFQPLFFNSQSSVTFLFNNMVLV